MRSEAGSGQIEAGAPRYGRRPAGIPRILAIGALALVALGTGAQATLAAGTATPATAPLSCTARTQSAVFAPWGDMAPYFLVSNGGFENGSTDWSLTGGAKVVGGNETFNVAGASDGHSLSLPPGAAAETRPFCVSRGEDTIRLFVNNSHTAGAILHVDAIVVNPDNAAVGRTSFDVNGDVPSSPWAPTIQLKIPNLLGGNGTEQLTLRFTLRGTQATWNIDDVYVDPFKSW
jgi:hypothetical protein